MSKKIDFDSQKYPLTFVSTYDQTALKERYQQAWSVAKTVATMLKEQYKTSKVVLAP